MRETIIEMGIGVVLALIGLLTAYFGLYIQKARKKVEAEIKLINDEKTQNLVREAFWTLDELIEKTVGSVEQTVAKDLRKLVKEGKFDKSELVKLKDNVFRTVNNELGSQYKKALEENVSGLKQFILDSIENKVLEVKALSNNFDELTVQELKEFENELVPKGRG